MITTAGKQAVVKYMASYNTTLGDSISVGIGSAAETINDAGLQLEVLRVPVDSVTANLNNLKLYYRAILPADFVGKITEMGLWNESGSSIRSSVLSDFTDDTLWSYGVLDLTNPRFGASTLRLNTPSGVPVTSVSTISVPDLQAYYTGLDYVKLGIFCDANSLSTTIKIGNDSANYIAKAFNLQPGYQILTAQLRDFTATGSPNPSSFAWCEITAIPINTTVSNFDYDVLSIQPSGILEDESVLVSRKVLTSFGKQAGRTMEIQYVLNLVFA